MLEGPLGLLSVPRGGVDLPRLDQVAAPAEATELEAEFGDGGEGHEVDLLRRGDTAADQRCASARHLELEVEDVVDGDRPALEHGGRGLHREEAVNHASDRYRSGLSTRQLRILPSASTLHFTVSSPSMRASRASRL